MTALTDYSTSAAQVRLLIADIDYSNQIFNDEAIDAFLALSDGNVKQAAAQALMVMAANYVQVRGQIRLLDVSTNGPADADALVRLAREYMREDDMTVRATYLTRIDSAADADDTEYAL